MARQKAPVLDPDATARPIAISAPPTSTAATRPTSPSGSCGGSPRSAIRSSCPRPR